MRTFDWLGFATFISSAGGVLLSMVIFGYKVYTDRQYDRAFAQQGVKLDDMHKLVNGQSEKLNQLTGKAAFARGVKAQKAKRR